MSNRTLLNTPALIEPDIDPKLPRDLKTLTRFVELYCHDHHQTSPKQPTILSGFDMHQLVGKEVALCPDCRRLLAHALIKRTHCPMSPKPACKHCPISCYHPKYREEIQKVMRYSGTRMVLRGRLDYLLRLLF